MSWDVGSVYPATLDVFDATGAPANPAAATLTVTLPDQTQASPPVTLPPAVTGVLTVNYLFTQPGLHKFAWATTGPTTAKTDYENAVNYISAVSLAAAKEHLDYSKTDKDERIRKLCSAATRHAEKIVGTLVPRAFPAEWIPGSYRPVIRVPHGPILTNASVTSVASAYGNGPSWGPADIIVNPYPGTIYLKSLIDFWYGPWLVNFVGGRAEIHEDITEGILEIVRDLFAPARGLSVDVAMQAAEDLNVSPFYRPPPRAAELLEPHRLPGFA